MEVQEIKGSGGEGGIRTLDTGFSPYNGLANRRLQPLGHLSGDSVDWHHCNSAHRVCRHVIQSEYAKKSPYQSGFFSWSRAESWRLCFSRTGNWRFGSAGEMQIFRDINRALRMKGPIF